MRILAGGMASILATSLACLLISVAVAGQLTPAQTDLAARALALDEDAKRLGEEGHYAEAISRAKEALALWEQAFGPNHPHVARELEWIGLHYFMMKDFSAAALFIQKALEIREGIQGTEHPALLGTLDRLALISSLDKEYRKAITLHERALAIREKTLGPDHPDVAETLRHLCLIHYGIGEYSFARPPCERRLAILEKAHGPNHLEVVDALLRLGEVLEHQGEYAQSRALYERALSIQELRLGMDRPEVADTLVNLSGVLRETGDYVTARPLIERALRIQEHAFGYQSPRLDKTLNYFAILLKATGDYSAAERLFKRALAIQEDALGPDDLVVGYTLADLGELLRVTGDLAEARPLFKRALQIEEQTLGPNHPQLAATLTDLGHLFMNTGDLDAAQRVYERALKIREGALGPNHPYVAQSINNLAQVLTNQRKYAEAQPLQERAVAIYEQSLAPTHPDLAVALNNLACILDDRGDYTTALSLMKRAVRIQEEVLGSEHPGLVFQLNNLASLTERTGDFAGASLLYRRALQIAEAKLGPNHPTTALVLANFAASDTAAGHPENAVPKLARALSIARIHRARGLVGLSNREKLIFLNNDGALTDALLSMPSNLVGDSEAYRAILDVKNQLFRTLASERSIVDTRQDPTVAHLLDDYTAVRRELSALTVHPPASSDPLDYQTRMANLTTRLEALEVELSRASASFRQGRTEEAAGPGEVCAALPTDAALLELFWYARLTPRPGAISYVAFILRGGDCATPIRVDLGPAAPIEEDVRQFRKALNWDLVDPDPAARAQRAQYRRAVAIQLHAKLFPPTVRDALAGKSRLLIAPDGMLALLPFALLPGEQGHEFLLETRTISYVPSGRDLLRPTQGAPATPALLAVGAPAFDQVPAQVAQAKTVRAGCGALEDRFIPLPGTAREVRAIITTARQARPTQAVTVLERAQATKAAFLEQAPKAGILHLATHAYFAGDECIPAGSAEARPQRTIGENPIVLGYNPLLLAGIALVGANEREKTDGILTALEITALDLRRTALVVLSACDTGLGTLAHGQELLGLRWAFAYAGVRNLVTSLWSIPDAETATLMTHFYTGLWLKGLSVAEALRVAQLEMLKAARARGDPAPHAWGAFVLSGAPD